MAHILRAQTAPSGVPGPQRCTDLLAGKAEVQYFEENDHRQFSSHYGTLSQVMREYDRKKSRRCIVFARNTAFAGNQDTTFLPPHFWSVVKDDLNGTFGLCRREEDALTPDNASYDTWSTFKIKHTYQGDDYFTIDYHWSQISVLVRQFKSRQFVLFVDCPASVIERLTRNLPQNARRSDEIDNPFVWHVSLVEELKDVYDTAVWDMRNIIRRREKERTNVWFTLETPSRSPKRPTPLYKPDIMFMKEVARHLIHINEAFVVTSVTLESIMHHHTNYFEETEREKAISVQNGTVDDQNRDRRKQYSRIQERLYIANKQISAIKSRASTLSERLNNEMDLYNHQLSMEIAESTRRDNAAMKALTLIGVLYLPGTYVSGIFGSNFFNYSPGSDGPDWNMSSKFWIYWVVTIPLTVLTFLGWSSLDEILNVWKQTSDNIMPSGLRGLIRFARPLTRPKNGHEEVKVAQV